MDDTIVLIYMLTWAIITIIPSLLIAIITLEQTFKRIGKRIDTILTNNPKG